MAFHRAFPTWKPVSPQAPLKGSSQGYIVELTAEESYVLRSKLLTLERKGNGSPGIRHGLSASLMRRDASEVSVWLSTALSLMEIQ